MVSLLPGATGCIVPSLLGHVDESAFWLLSGSYLVFCAQVESCTYVDESPGGRRGGGSPATPQQRQLHRQGAPHPHRPAPAGAPGGSCGAEPNLPSAVIHGQCVHSSTTAAACTNAQGADTQRHSLPGAHTPHGGEHQCGY